MDSGSSGSMQSSSGGDEELESLADTISAFTSHPQNHVSSAFKSPVPHPQPKQHQTHMFDPLSSFLDQIQRLSSSLSHQNLVHSVEMLWSKPLISVPDGDLAPLMPSSSSSLSTAFFQSQIGSGQTGGTTGLADFPATQHPPDSTGASPSAGLLSVTNSNDPALQINGNNHNTLAPNSSTTTNPDNNMMRNPKKRSRASSRVPTTVLTTDAANFRIMVQEFTGIPAPPFTLSSFTRSRLDLFDTDAASNLQSAHFDPSTVPPYILRPLS